MFSIILSFLIDTIWGLIKKPFVKTPEQRVMGAQNAEIKTLANERELHADDSLSRGEF